MVISWLRRWLQRNKSVSQQRKTVRQANRSYPLQRFRTEPLRLERLEDRTMLSVTVIQPNLTPGQLEITLSAKDDSATISLFDPSTLDVFDGTNHVHTALANI